MRIVEDYMWEYASFIRVASWWIVTVDELGVETKLRSNNFKLLLNYVFVVFRIEAIYGD
jgi:hypothetical protein